MARAKILVSVNGDKPQDVITTANKHKVKSNSLYMALRHNQTKFFNYDIKKLDENLYSLTTRQPNLITNSTKLTKKKAVRVKCLETNTIYPSIKKAAIACNANMWTMSLKMEETGKFVDKQGNTYIRLAPMAKRTNRIYDVKSSEITRIIKPYTKKNNNIVTTPVLPTIVSTKDTIVQSLIKSANLLINNKNYGHAAEVLSILDNFDKE